MTHDIQDLLDLIKELEERIIKLEQIRSNESILVDNWYWDH